MLEQDEEFYPVEEEYYTMTEDGAKVLLEWIRFNVQLLEIQGLADEYHDDGSINDFDKWILMTIVLNGYCQMRGWKFD